MKLLQVKRDVLIHFSTTHVMLKMNKTKKEYPHLCIIEKNNGKKLLGLLRQLLISVVLSSVYKF